MPAVAAGRASASRRAARTPVPSAKTRSMICVVIWPGSGSWPAQDAFHPEFFGCRLDDRIEDAVGLFSFGGAFLADSGDEETEVLV